VSSKAVSAYIAHIFDSSLPMPTVNPTLNPTEKKWGTRIVMMLRGAEAGEVTVIEKRDAVKENLGEDGDVEWDYEEQNNRCTSLRHTWTKEKMEKAYAFYRQGK
ncbi:hypothetical protein PMAYCL1PPCAC_32146, partial [Pristionchus mayeri]